MVVQNYSLVPIPLSGTLLAYTKILALSRPLKQLKKSPYRNASTGTNRGVGEPFRALRERTASG